VGVLPRGKSSITVTELPYGVGAEKVIAKVKELVTGKKLQGIADVKDLTDRQLGTTWSSRSRPASTARRCWPSSTG
jgi:DNA gyrase/topoisomerase IV subunit A